MDSEKLLNLAKILADHQGKSLATISTLVTGSGDTFKRIDEGRDVTTRRATLMYASLREMWPNDLPWPLDARQSPCISDPKFPRALCDLIPNNGQTDAVLTARARDAGIDCDGTAVRWAIDVLANLDLIRVDRHTAEWYVVRPREVA